MDYGCSALTVRTPEGGVLMGRNFDFNSATGIVLHTVPEQGYETYTTFNTNFLGFGEGWLPEGFKNQYMALSVLFFALDGINEKGLAVLLRGIDMHSDIGAAHHYAISDATGRSVVVEYVDNRMEVVESAAVANHYLCEAKLNVGLIKGDRRYEVLCSLYDATRGIMDKMQLTKTIASVSLPPTEGGHMGTAWTLVMDLTSRSILSLNGRENRIIADSPGSKRPAQGRGRYNKAVKASSLR